MSSMPRPRRSWSSLVGLLLVLAVAGGAEAGPAGATRRPGFRLPTLDGHKVGPADYPGKVILADFWATWCGPCHLQAEILHKVQAQYPRSDVQFLAIDVGEDEKTVRAFVSRRPFPYPVLLDEEEKVSGDFGVIGYPTLLIIDRKGEISYLQAGIVPERRLHDLLGKAGAPPPPAPQPSPTAAAKPLQPVAAGES